MATRDLTAKYRKFRQNFYKNQSAIPSNFLNETSPPFWVHIVKNVEEHIKLTQETIEKLHEAHKNRLMVRFDDDMDDARDEAIDRLTTKITDTLKNARDQLIQIDDKEASADEQAVFKNIRRTLAGKLQDLSLTFRKSQKEYLERLKAQKTGKSMIFLDDKGDDDLESGYSKTGGGVHLSEGEMILIEDNQNVLRERDAEIQKIATSITELATIFRELAVLVIEQGTILDRIDYNMDMVVDTTQKAVKTLADTQAIQKQARPQKCIFVLVVIIFILLVILAYKHSS